MKRPLILFLVLSVASLAVAQPQGPFVRPERFREMADRRSPEWLSSAEARAIADTVLAYQFPAGGWCKNQNWNLPPTDAVARERASMRHHMVTDGIGTTIDNGATTNEILFLTHVYAATSDERYREGALRGVRWLLDIQYPNGGWPQFYPPRSDNADNVTHYSDFITFNDDAMVHVMRLLDDVAHRRAPYDALRPSRSLRRQAKRSFRQGVKCILDCQIQRDGHGTVWCMQHNQYTLAPEHARAYELPSFNASGETVGILKLLMDLPRPSRRVRTAVADAVDWLDSHATTDMALEHYRDSTGRFDTRLVPSPGAPRLWARFYDLETEQPFFCDRDGIPRPHLEDIGYERRNGYSWLGKGPQAILDRYEKRKK